MGTRREITAAVVDRYRSAGRIGKGRILDELCAVTGWHRKHAVRALASHVGISPEARRQRSPTYDATIRDALVALWEASDRICGKRLKVMIPTLLPWLERHGRLKLDQAGRALVLGVSAATIDRLLVETKIAAAGGKRRRVGFYSAVRREVPIRTFNDWHDPPPGFCEVDVVAHGGTSVAGSFIQTLTMVDVATGWTECMPLVTRESGLVVRAMECAGGVGRFCREREQAVTDLRRVLDAALSSVEHAADPQTDAAIKIVAWLSRGTLKPTADDFAMLRLMLLALLPQVGGILLMIGRGR